MLWQVAHPPRTADHRDRPAVLLNGTRRRLNRANRQQRGQYLDHTLETDLLRE